MKSSGKFVIHTPKGYP